VSDMDNSVDELLAELAAAPLLDPPEQVSRRWHRALAELPPPVAGPLPRHRWATSRRAAVALAAAASAVGLMMAGQPEGPVAAPLHRTAPAPAFAHPDPNQVGELADPARRTGCLTRIGLPGVTVLTTRRVDWHGHPAVQLVLTTPIPGQVRTVTVTTDCGPSTGHRLVAPGPR